MSYTANFKKAILENSISTNYEDAIKEWIPSFLGSSDGPKSQCICTHEITENCHVQNLHSGKILVVGNVCINKFFPRPAILKFEQLQHERRLEERKTKDCETEGCNSRIAKIHVTRTVCNRCLQRIAHEESERQRVEAFLSNRKKCETELCRQLISTTPAWKTHCPTCYNRLLRDSDRWCDKAGCDRKILQSEPKWKKTCLEC